MDIPQKVIEDIAQELDLGLRCFIHKETLEVISLPDEDQLFQMDTDAWQDDIDKVDENREKYLVIEKMRSHDSFRVMEGFVDSINDEKLKLKLIQALEGRKPFANFKFQIDNSGPFREMWFAFKNEKMIEWVKDQLSIEYLKSEDSVDDEP